MTQLEAHYLSGYACDKPGCTDFIRGDELPYWEGREHYWALAKALGWTMWTGRSQRTYCSAHLPAPGHKMRQVK